MHRSPNVTRLGHSWSLVAALVAIAALVFAACGGSTATTAPAASEAASAAPSAEVSSAPYEGMAYPETGEAPCGDGTYSGEM